MSYQLRAISYSISTIYYASLTILYLQYVETVVILPPNSKKLMEERVKKQDIQIWQNLKEIGYGV